jgi:isopropylmalate/homocitrate/citramalate synthase
MTDKIKLVEVGPRDGLQNEKQFVPTDVKLVFIDKLISAGLKNIEATSFVSPKWIPQLADNDLILAALRANQTYNDISFPVLVPNLKGLELALTHSATHIALFTAASETFNQKNIRCTIEESFGRFTEMLPLIKKHNLKVRGYVSCALGCPYEGKITPQAVLNVAEKLIALGCNEVSIGDTIGVGTPKQAYQLFELLSKNIPIDKLAMHFHDTYGQALANICAVLELGVRTIDSSIAGLGGCPYAKGASGNVATEDVAYLLNGLGFQTGVDLKKLVAAGLFITKYLKILPRSKVSLAMSNQDQ